MAVTRGLKRSFGLPLILVVVHGLESGWADAPVAPRDTLILPAAAENCEPCSESPAPPRRRLLPASRKPAQRLRLLEAECVLEGASAQPKVQPGTPDTTRGVTETPARPAPQALPTSPALRATEPQTRTADPRVPVEKSPAQEVGPAVPPSREARPESLPPPTRLGNVLPPPPAREQAKHVLNPGDILEVVFMESWVGNDPYRLQPGDDIRVEFLNLRGLEGGQSAGEGLDRTVKVQPDGRFALPYVGVVNASGRSIGELAEQLNQRYREYYVEPRILLTLLNTGDAIERLRAGLRAERGGTEVLPDGRVNLPGLGPVRGAGLTLQEFQAELTERYARFVGGVSVSVRLIGLSK